MSMVDDYTAGYAVIGQPEVSRLNDVGSVEYGRNITVRDLVTNTVFNVFVQDQNYTRENVQLAIAEKLAVVRSVASLGQ